MDFSELRKSSLRLLNAITEYRERPIVNSISVELLNEPRIKLLRGLRGVGKTTMLLQLFKKNVETSFYFTMDNPITKSAGLYTLGKELILSGFKTLFIDEVHTYPNWRSDLKALYDEFPKSYLVCSGSAPLALIPERREKEHAILPLSLSEYIYLKTGLTIEFKAKVLPIPPSNISNIHIMGSSEEAELNRYKATLIYQAKETIKTDIWLDEQKTIEFLATKPEVESNYQEYLKTGGFPLSLSYNSEDALNAIYSTIRKSIKEDSVTIMKASIEKVFAMEQIVIKLAISPPGELSITGLSNYLGISKSSTYEILQTLIEMKILRMVRPYTKGSSIIHGEPKILFAHPNLRYCICFQLKREADIGAIREESTLFALEIRNWNFNTIKGAKKSPDYVITKGNKTIVLEIGGNKKSRQQLAYYKEKYKTLVISDNEIKALLCI